MKKRNKLNVNLKKEISDAELVNLRGGSGEDYFCTCRIDWGDWIQYDTYYSSLPCAATGEAMLQYYAWYHAFEIECWDA